MIGFPFDSQVTYDEELQPVYDRAISSLPLRKLINKLFTNGVMPDDGETKNFLVSATTGMNVKVKAGFAIVNGCMKLEEQERTIAIEASENGLDRIDTIVLRLNDETDARILDLYVHKGTPATNPQAPELTRQGSVYELGLANVFIPKQTTAIPQQRITDTRLDSTRCGVISSISKFDTTSLYNQIQADLSDFKTNQESDFAEWVADFEANVTEFEESQYEDFETWFDMVQGKLSDDVATQLQSQINAITYIYAENETLYLPNTAGTVTDDTLVLYGNSNEPESEG